MSAVSSRRWLGFFSPPGALQTSQGGRTSARRLRCRPWRRFHRYRTRSVTGLAGSHSLSDTNSRQHFHVVTPRHIHMQVWPSTRSPYMKKSISGNESLRWETRTSRTSRSFCVARRLFVWHVSLAFFAAARSLSLTRRQLRRLSRCSLLSRAFASSAACSALSTLSSDSSNAWFRATQPNFIAHNPSRQYITSMRPGRAASISFC